MVITIIMKNVIKRGDTYYFRIGVPNDCQESVGKTEITQSLKTNDPAVAASLAKGLVAGWKQKFRKIRNPSTAASPAIASTTDNTVNDFRDALNAHMKQHLKDCLDKQSDAELYVSSEFYRDCISMIGKNDRTHVDLSEELGIQYPLPKQKSPGMTRSLNKVLIEALDHIRAAIDAETGREVSKEIEENILEPHPLGHAPEAAPSVSPRSGSGTDIAVVMNLMLDAKDTKGKFKELIQAEIGYLQEWLDGKTDLTAFSKADLVDYARNCLPYIPKNMRHNPDCKGKSLKECVAMVIKGIQCHAGALQGNCVRRETEAALVQANTQVVVESGFAGAARGRTGRHQIEQAIVVQVSQRKAVHALLVIGNAGDADTLKQLTTACGVVGGIALRHLF